MKAVLLPLFLCMLLVCVEASHAESWPTLDSYVARCSLIVLCETEIHNRKPVFKVVESWKGKYNLKLFTKTLQHRAPSQKHLPAGLGLHSGRESYLKQKVVFFFTTNQKRPYSGSSTSFDVRKGKLTYAETGHPGMPMEYTLKQFKSAVKKIVDAQAAETFSGKRLHVITRHLNSS